jgi:enoyl-CoA hydratase
MTASGAPDDRVLFEVDPDRRIATITLNNPKQRNSYDAAMRDALARCLDRVADDDDLTVMPTAGMASRTPPVKMIRRASAAPVSEDDSP